MLTAGGRKILKWIAVTLGIIAVVTVCVSAGLIAYFNDEIIIGEEANMRLKYDKAATELGLNHRLSRASKENDIWQQNTLPIGNGSVGGSIYGEVFDERIIFNEKTLWTGGPSPTRPDYNGGNLTAIDSSGKTVYDYYRDVQRLFAEGRNDEASALCNKLIGIEDGYGAYQCWGEIDIRFNHSFKRAEEYMRTLSLDDAIAAVSYKGNDTTFNREYFASYNNNVLAIKLTADGVEKLDIDLSFPSAQEGAESVAESNVIQTYGALTDNGLQYYSRIDVLTQADCIAKEGHISVKGADEIVLIVSAATDYANDYPAYRTGESESELRNRVDMSATKAVDLGYEVLREEHIVDYKILYNRVSLNLGGVEPADTTDRLLKAYRSGFIRQSQRRYLEQLLYNYGRYLMISSSRETDVLPSNLQGLWNNQNNPPWASDYHMNVNLQMNYWPAYNTNLSECATPLINYVDSLREPGRVTAKTYAGIVSKEGEENGFVFHTQNTPFGWTCPGWDFSWGWSPAATAWIIQNVYEHYEYTGDREYLRTKIYPIMREASLYFKSVLVEDKDTGRLVTCPAFSPEHGPRTMGNTYEQSLIWQLFTDTVTAAETLGLDSELVSELNGIIDRLNPIEIGESGQIKEWYHETKLGKIGEKKHRHMSHLLGLFPGDLINKDTHPEWLQAALVSLNNRSDKSTGWAMGQRINTWARTGDGDRAYKLIQQLFKSGIYANMWDAHPPFQIDGNFGYTSGVTEMLMQSNLGYIELLPALPSSWADGKINGIVARGNFELSVEWENGKMTRAGILSRSGGECVIKCGKTDVRITDSEGNEVNYRVEDGKIIFNTRLGERYTVV